jgi:tRNA-Thr(GGU) m(6)t(6)A37 methyltransferase TsaA
MPAMRPPRPGEKTIDLPTATDAGVHFIGRIRTPWKTTAECPKNIGLRKDVLATIDIDQLYAEGLKDIGLMSHLIVLYWLHLSRRDCIIQAPSHAPEPRGVFALRSPVRPNPIGLAVVELVAVEGNRLTVRNLDCVDGTPVIDVKPYFSSIDSVPDAKRP